MASFRLSSIARSSAWIAESYSVAQMKLYARGTQGAVEKVQGEGFAMLEDATEAERKAFPKFAFHQFLSSDLASI